MQQSLFPWKGVLLGFLFGVIGIWILAALSLAIPLVEYIAAPLFVPGRFLASVLVRDGSASSLETIIVFALSGFLYAVIGACAQLLGRMLWKA